MIDENRCDRCDGCGKIASGEEGAPWSMWLEMPLKSCAAVLMEIVKPIPCPKCGGTGKRSEAREGAVDSSTTEKKP